ncbi:hypothetical protein TPY_3195 [Sulfobacillus acidophilus TPY]|uniref:Uncharacterized protein n=1 Tax=Sulfobacillus acidophilus (strain ATCC 700253 / DSM 10332 / NAL) TaxID=679936 RepID=G8TZH4_SULAD|nr:hypothetical protein TPY_3195 [Sulfobacillus acidophilus TPY]AEW05214.1 hypothetical protein Sulac_1718 [Sulfobacillus acidophilus DSM 10332]
MGPLIQELVLKGQGRLYEQDFFLAATTTQPQTFEPAANFVWIFYEFDLEPHDINLSLQLTGPNIAGNATLRSLGRPLEGAYLAIPGGPLNATMNNNTDSGAVITFRYVELTAYWYAKLMNPAYAGETAAWTHVLNQANTMPGAPAAKGGGR